MNPDTDTTAELEEVEEEDPDSGDAYKVGYFGVDQTSSRSITKKEFGDPWIVNVPKNEVSYLSFYTYKQLKFPHTENKLGILTTFHPIHYDEKKEFYIPGFEGHQFFHTTPIGKYELARLVPNTWGTRGFHDNSMDQHFYISSVDYLTLEETHKQIENGFTLVNI
jgi:hypothetical protein